MLRSVLIAGAIAEEPWRREVFHLPACALLRPWLPDSGAAMAADDDWAGRGDQPRPIAGCPGRALPLRPLAVLWSAFVGSRGQRRGEGRRRGAAPVES